ncbi:hypothetical protein [Corynebacterium yonathiae]|uniref:DUF2567 domain-containing protein n=1 Tax=Corynebacterium yonathiae TaxID=2913504 RepID=A0A9X3LWX3_9CORY|nr:MULTISPECIES: hypothetical protein [Corynebacterium]MCZ9295620.1 hypothetical protein [Corynebacterium yonathiae]MDK2582164.1 hypothetical protein [Corynebacterium sp. BWA136]
MATGPSVTKLSLFQRRLPRTLGFGAGLLACALLVFGVAGVLWGLFRPTLTGREVEDGGYAIESMGSAQFIAFITFALITGLLGLLLGLGAYLRRQGRGLSMLLWVGVCALAGAASFYVFGGATATHPPENPGEVVEFAPNFSPAISWAVAPFMAMFSYWSTAFVSADDDW